MADVAVVTDVGLSVVTAAIKAYGSLEPLYAYWGTGGATATAANTTMESVATHETVVTGGSSFTASSTVGDTYKVTATITCISAAKTITEVGLFAGSSAGATMFMHGTFTGIAVSVGDSIGFTIKNTFNQA